MRRHPLFVLASLAFLLTGCPSEPVPNDPDAGAGEDAGTPPDDAMVEDDAQVPIDGGPDAGPIDGGMIDPEATTPTLAPTVVRNGTGGLLLRGTVLTPTGPLVGEVLVVGHFITCVAADCGATAMADTVTVIDTHGAVISPGLLDAHNHLSYDFLDEWIPEPPGVFVSRYEWRTDDDYRMHVAPEGYKETIDGRMVDVAVCPGSKWGELRSIIHGTTTVQGQAPSGAITCLDRLARNADNYHGLERDFMRVTIAGPCESSFPSRTGLITDFGDGDARRFVVHVGEGYAPHGTPGSSSDPTREFECYAGRTVTGPGLLFDASGNPFETGVMIHAMPLTTAQLDESVSANVRFVWSPSSNLILYERTAPIAEMIARGLTVAIAPDWTVSGTDEMLSELRYGHEYGRTVGIPELTPRRLFEMASIDAAEVLGMEEHVGRIEVGLRADLVVFGRSGADPYRAVLDSRAEDVRLTLIDGVGYYGDISLEGATAVNGVCDTLDVCGTERYLCVRDTPGAAAGIGDTLESLSTELTRILDVFGRGDELLPLVDCSL